MAEAWYTSLPNRLRYLINDIATPQTFTDFQLKTYIAIAAVAVSSEVSLGTTFTIDTDNPSISPDPLSGTINTGIPHMFIMKAACLIVGGELRKDAAKFGIKIKDHLTAYDGTEGMKAKGQIVENFCQSYEDAKFEWEVLNRASGRAVVGPFSYYDSTTHSERFALDWSKDNSNDSVK